MRCRDAAMPPAWRSGTPGLEGFVPLPSRGVVVTDVDVERVRDELGV